MKKEKKEVERPTLQHDQEGIPNPKNMEDEENTFPGYPHYPGSEDIYSNETEVDLNPDDLSKNKAPKENYGKRNEKDFSEDMTGEDLDIPGSKEDEAKGNAGREDEENNYYSLGGDNHNDLEEDKG
jgi:hypothetical protein